MESPIRGSTLQWGQSSAPIRRAAEQQAKCHAQHASVPFDMEPPAEFWEDAVEIELHAGDVLYVPAGMYHRVQCYEDSLSINVSIMGGERAASTCGSVAESCVPLIARCELAASWADLMSEAVRQCLLQHSLMRAPMRFRSVAHGRKQLRRMLELLSSEVEVR